MMVKKAFWLHINMSTEEMKRHDVIVSLVEKHSDLETAAFLKLVQSFYFENK